MLPPKSLVKEIPTTQVAAMVTRVFMLKNRTLNDSTLIFTANEMQKILRGNYYYLTVEEVKNALEKGVYGHYGEYYEIGVVTMCNWLDAYLNSDERRGYVESHRPKMLAIAPKATLTEGEKRKYQREFLLMKFETFRKIKRCDTLAQLVYKYLVEYGFINPSNDEKYVALDRAEKVMFEQRKQTHGLKLRELLTRLNDGNTYKETKIAIAKRLIVEDFFRVVIDTEKETKLIEKLKKND